MCGILIHKKDFKPVFNIDHRGLEVNKVKKGGWNFIHSNLPLQSAGLGLEQPIRYQNGDILLFNGEIFNVKEISGFTNDLSYLEDLFKKGFNHQIIMEANKWDGFWSIVYYDSHREEFFCFTDPLGKKQLYYSDQGICSEIKPLIEIGRSPLREEYGYGTENTMFNNIRRILPNSIYCLNEDVKEIFHENYYTIEGSSKNDFFPLMEKSVKDRLVNQIDDITIFLSGGLDSTIILHHLLDQFPKKNIQFLTIDNEEFEYVDILEDYYKIQIERIPIGNLSDDIVGIVSAYEIPIDYGSLIPQWYLAKHSKNRVVLTGDGADELFGGYKRAQKGDTYDYDVFSELPYLHHIRLDRITMNFTKELRNPFLSRDIISFSASLPYERRRGKEVLKETYKGKIPDQIIDREKRPLRYKGEKDYNKYLISSTFKGVFSNFMKKNEYNPPQ